MRYFMPKSIDLIRKRFSRLVVTERVRKDKHGKILWLCQCDCGEEKIVQSGHLKSGHTKSCGCLRKNTTKRTGLSNIKHGHAQNEELSRTYTSWKNMKSRCTNPSNPNYKNYGGRGITICYRWRNSFPNFLQDMGERPSRLTIERIKNKLGYYKNNCRWATKKEQNRNKRSNLFLTYKGKIQLVIDWVKEYNIPYSTLCNRLYKLNWPIEKALTIPIRKWGKT